MSEENNVTAVNDDKVKFSIKNLNLHYGSFHALKNISMDIMANKITALIGPSGCGKSTFLKTLNRMNDLVEGVKIDGDIKLDGNIDVNRDMDAIELRKRVGMVFQQPNPFPKSIYENVAYGPRINGVKKKSELDEIVERSLKQAAIWDELKDRLDKSALGLSGGQQQRLCIARTLAVEPEVILMDEPTSALDPISTSRIEDLAVELKKDYTIVIVTHNMQQAVAKDLRTISAALKMITDMERIGDQASDIAEIIATTTTPETPEVPKLYDMSKEAANMVNNAITAYVNKDLTLAGKVEANDDVVDNYFTEIREELIDYIIKNPGSNAAKAIDLIMICKYLERIGDHATNIAEWVVFSITGVHEGHIDTKAPVETKNILKAE